MRKATFKINSLAFQSRFLLVTLCVSIVLLLARAIYINGPDVVVDDAYISFRYALNWVNGAGLVYNLGEHVEGYTNFLWTVLLAGCAYLGFDIAFCSKILSVCMAICTLFIIYRFSQHLFTGHQVYWVIAALPLILFSVMPSQARYVVSGMETLLFVFLLTFSTYLFYKCKWAASGVVYALTAITRPEGLMYFVIAFGFGLVLLKEGTHQPPEMRQFISRFLVSFVLIYGSYFLWRYSYYGYLFPNTFYAKAPSLNFANLERGWNTLGEVFISWNILPLLFLGFFALPSARSDRIWYLFAGFVLITAIYFLYIGGDFVVWFGPRFFMPVLPFILLMAAEGIHRIISTIQLQGIRLILVWLIPLLLILNGLWLSWPARFDQLDTFKSQMRSWRELGNWMKLNLPAETKIATDAAGLIPFYSNLYAIDMFGLTDEHIAHLDVSDIGKGVVAHEKYDPFYILRRKPDCLVSTWMNEQGQAISAGLDAVTQGLEGLYELVAVAKVRYGAPPDGRWVIATSTYSQALFKDGYQTGLFCLKANQ